jgi:intracellular sulfur oxidation DsrE/DsrF family protein
MDKFSELKAAAMAATPGPWAYEAYGDTGQYGVGVLLDENDEPKSGRQEQGEMLVVESVASLVNGAPNAAFIAVANPAAVLELLAERDADKKRIAELEDVEQKLCAANVTLDARASAAEAKLATPVRLLGEMLPHEWERAERQAAFEHRKIAWDARLAEDKKAILAAGFTFTVEGDE